MKVRTKLLAIFLAVFSASAYSEVSSTAKVISPYQEVTPYVKADETRIIAFMKFNCPICRNYNMTLDFWGKSLPKEFSFQYYPVIESGSSSVANQESTAMSMVFWAVDRIATKDQKTEFAELMYEAVQDQGQVDAKSFISIAANIGIKKDAFIKSWQTEQEIWTNRISRQYHYKPTVTPSLVICGKWMISPDSTNGNQELFMQLANALVSKCMVDHGIKYIQPVIK